MLTVDVVKTLAPFTLRARFDAPTPGIVALLGRSGCGKTTTVNMIAGLVRPDRGRIELDGALLQDCATGVEVAAERRAVGYVFQDARLFPHLKVLGNLRYGRTRARGRVCIGFDDVVSLLGLEKLIDRRVHALSGGERQRVALGRALLSQPRLLLLDEPLASLDGARREEVLPYLEQLPQQLSIPIVYVSHQFEEVLRLASHVVLMERGEVRAQGSLNEVSLSAALRDIVGADAVGAVVEGRVLSDRGAFGLAEVGIGSGIVHIGMRGPVIGASVRLQLLARDIIIAIERPRGLSVRNEIEGTIVALSDDDEAVMVRVDVGGPHVLARITRSAASTLDLATGKRVWVLIKAVSVRGYPAGRGG